MAMTNPGDRPGKITDVERVRRWTGRSAFLLPVLLVALLFVSAYFGISREINRIAEEQLSRELDLVMITVDDKLFSSTRNLESYQNEVREALSEPKRDSVNEVLADIVNSEVGIDHVGLFSREGKGLYQFPEGAEPPGVDRSQTHWFRDYVERGRRSMVSDISGVRSDEPLTVIVVPLKGVPGHEGISMYAAIRLTSITSWLSPFHIGESGGLALLDRHRRVIASSASLGLPISSKFTGKCQDCLTGERLIFDSWRVVAILPKSDIRSSIVSSLSLPLLAGLGLIAISGLIGLRIRNLNDLSARQQRAVEEARNQMEANFKELESGLLPVIPDIPGWDISLSHTSATHGTRIGGDFFDVFTSKSGDLITVIGDVSGKGLTASAIATGARTATRAFFETTDDPRQVLTSLNRYMVDQTPRNIFITMLICVFSDSKIKIATAGHPLPVFSGGGDTMEPAVPTGLVGLPLAIFPDASYDLVESDAPPDINAIFYTDGLIESRGSEGLFGAERVVKFFGEFVSQGLDPDEIAERMRKEATDWSLGELKDDLAIICVARRR